MTPHPHKTPSGRRLDMIMVERGLAESQEKAQRLIMAGEVRVDGQPAGKAGHKAPEDARIEVMARPRFVGRGGDKFQAAIDGFGIVVKGLVCLDVGASTGGFTDCLLQNGAAKVYAVDVGRGQIHEKLRTDPRVVVMDEINARYLKPELFGEPAGLAVIDVSFISLTKILPAVIQVIAPTGSIVTLIKPQFEAGRKEVGRGGVIEDPAVRARVVEEIRLFGVEKAGLEWLGAIESPLKGPAGNVEFLGYWKMNRIRQNHLQQNH